MPPKRHVNFIQMETTRWSHSIHLRFVKLTAANHARAKLDARSVQNRVPIQRMKCIRNAVISVCWVVDMPHHRLASPSPSTIARKTIVLKGASVRQAWSDTKINVFQPQSVQFVNVSKTKSMWVEFDAPIISLLCLASSANKYFYFRFNFKDVWSSCTNHLRKHITRQANFIANKECGLCVGMLLCSRLLEK